MAGYSPPARSRWDAPTRMPAWHHGIVSAITSQLAYYLSASNLASDAFLRSRMHTDGWVALELVAGFPRIQAILAGAGVHGLGDHHRIAGVLADILLQGQADAGLEVDWHRLAVRAVPRRDATAPEAAQRYQSEHVAPAASGLLVSAGQPSIGSAAAPPAAVRAPPLLPAPPRLLATPPPLRAPFPPAPARPDASAPQSSAASASALASHVRESARAPADLNPGIFEGNELDLATPESGWKPRPRAAGANTCYVANLAARVDNAILAELFSHAGPVQRAYIATDSRLADATETADMTAGVATPSGERSRFRGNIAFVEFVHEASVDYACRLFNGTRLFDEAISVAPSGQAERARHAARHVFLRPLDDFIQEYHLMDLGSVAGGDPIASKIVRDAITGKSRGFGFLMYETIEEANAAVQILDDLPLLGRRLRASLSTSSAAPQRSTEARDEATSTSLRDLVFVLEGAEDAAGLQQPMVITEMQAISLLKEAAFAVADRIYHEAFPAPSSPMRIDEDDL